MQEPRPQQLFHIVSHDPPTADDFRSYKDMGIALRFPGAEAERCHDGVSFFDTPERAARSIRRPSPAAALVARIDVPVTLRVERTFMHREGHYTAWAPPQTLLGLVREVVVVAPVQ